MAPCTLSGADFWRRGNQEKGISIDIHTPIHVPIPIHTHRHTYTYTLACAYMYTYACTYRYTYSYTDACACVCPCTYTSILMGVFSSHCETPRARTSASVNLRVPPRPPPAQWTCIDLHGLKGSGFFSFSPQPRCIPALAPERCKRARGKPGPLEIKGKAPGKPGGLSAGTGEVGMGRERVACGIKQEGDYPLTHASAHTRSPGTPRALIYTYIH